MPFNQHNRSGYQHSYGQPHQGWPHKSPHQDPASQCQLDEWVDVPTETTFMYAGTNLLGEYDANSQAKQEIVWMGGIPVGLVQNGQLYQIYTNQMGAPTAVTDSRGTVVWNWEPRPFGDNIANEDPDGDGNLITLNLRFPGQYYDQESGLSYNYYRYYDASTGRYIQSDPSGLDGGLNTYGYAGGSPLALIDPYGLSAWGSVKRWSYDDVGGFTHWLIHHANDDIAQEGGWRAETWGFFAADLLNSLKQADSGCYKAAALSAVLALVKPVKLAKKLEKVAKSADKLGDFAHNYQRSVGAAQRVPSVLQSGGNKLSNRTSKGLNEYFRENLTKRDWGRALEGLKKDNGLRNDHHGRILDNGDYVNDAGDLLGNISHYLP